MIAGLDYTRRHGRKSCKAVGRPRVIFRRDRILEIRAAGLSWRQVATKLGTTVTTVRRAVAIAGQDFSF